MVHGGKAELLELDGNDLVTVLRPDPLIDFNLNGTELAGERAKAEDIIINWKHSIIIPLDDRMNIRIWSFVTFEGGGDEIIGLCCHLHLFD